MSKSAKRSLQQRLAETSAEFDDRIKRLRVDKSIALGRIKANAKPADLAELRIDFVKDSDCQAFIQSKLPPKPDPAPTETGRKGQAAE